MLLNNLAILFLFICSAYIMISKKPKKRLNSLQKLLILYFLAHLISLAYSDNFYEGVKTIEKYLTFLIFPIMILAHNGDEIFKKKLKRVYYVTTTIILIFAFTKASYNSYLNQTIYIFNPENLVIENQFLYHRLMGYFGNSATMFSLYICMSLAFMIEEFFKNKNVSKWMYLSASILLVGLILTQSFTSLVIFFFMLIASAIFFSRFIKQALWMLSATFVLALFLFSQKAGDFDTTILNYDLKNNIHHKSWNSLNVRLAKWECALEVINENLPFGVGAGSTQQTLNEKYKHKGFDLGYEKQFSTHNQFLNVLVETGIIGIIVFVLLIISGFIHSIKEKNYSLFALMLILFLSSVTDSVLIVNKGIVFFAFFLTQLSETTHESEKAKVLFMLQLPPPLHGASLMNQNISKSNKINSEYNTDYIDLNFSSDIHDIGKLRIGKLYMMFSILITMIIKVSKNNYNLVYFTLSPHGPAFYRDAVFVGVLKLFRKKIVFHLHGKGIKNKLESRFNRLLYKFIFKNVEVITLSSLLNYDIENIYNKAPFVLANGIKLEPVSTLEPNKNKRTLLFLSNLIKAKGILIFIDAIEQVLNENANFKVKIVGDSGDVSIEEVRRVVADKNLQSYVEVLGPKYGSDKEKILLDSDVLVLPTENECFPLVILEAMAKGLVIISTKVGAIPEIVQDGINGKVIEQPNVQFLKKAILDCIKMEDFELQAIRVRNIQKFKDNYSFHTFELNFINIINKILKNNRRDSS